MLGVVVTMDGYYGKTNRHLKTRVSEHTGISALTGKSNKSKPSAIGYQPGPGRRNYNYKVFDILKIKDSLFIMKDKPILNKKFKCECLSVTGKVDALLFL